MSNETGRKYSTSQEVGKQEDEPKKKVRTPKVQNVVATRAGFFNNIRIEAGDKLTLNYAEEFSKKWMKKI